MSSGKTHVKASLILSAGFSIGAMVSNDASLLRCVLGALCGIFLTPDLDVDKTYEGEKIIEKKIGWFGKRLWNLFWRPYKTSFKHGRFASHFPIFSTFARLLYIYFWVILLPHIIIKLLFNSNWDLMYVLAWYAKIFLNFQYVYGLMSSDVIHYFLDVLTKNAD